MKQHENEAALKVLRSRLQEIDNLVGASRQLEIIFGLLAGNIFDWGAHESMR